MGKMYVGNLSWQATDDDLKKFFNPYGTVKSASIVKDKTSGSEGRSRGFAFVEMETDAETNAAIENLNGKEFMGRTLKVNAAIERKKDSGDSRSHREY